jgi:hypothetical protein
MTKMREKVCPEFLEGAVRLINGKVWYNKKWNKIEMIVNVKVNLYCQAEMSLTVEVKI